MSNLHFVNPAFPTLRFGPEERKTHGRLLLAGHADIVDLAPFSVQ
jgi:hypothetical protein